MDTTGLYNHFRAEMVDLAEPYLWDDPTVFHYMNDAQRMFCRLTEGIEDATSSLTRISVVPNTEWYKTSPLILKIRTASRTDTGRAIPIENPETLDKKGIRFFGVVGVLGRFVRGLTKNMLRAYPIPNETVTVQLAVFRLPLYKIEGPGQDFEIDEQHHEHLLLWMRHKAYDRQDSDTFDRRKSDECKQSFEEYCMRSRGEQERARRNVGVVTYGGI